MGRYLIFLGIALVAIGLILQYAPWLLNWFGRLPGDIRIDNEKTKVFIPNNINDSCKFGINAVSEYFQKIEPPQNTSSLRNQELEVRTCPRLVPFKNKK